MSRLSLPEFKIRYLLSFIFYLIAVVVAIHGINWIGVYFYGLGFLNWWPLGHTMLFGLGGQPAPVLSALVSGLAVDITVPGLDDHLKAQWLSRSGLLLLTTLLFLTILATLRRMLLTVDVKQPFDIANVRRVQFIIAIIVFEMLCVDYWRTKSMLPVKALVDKMPGAVMETDSSYVNADAYAYVLLLLLLTLLAIFRRGVALLRQQKEMEKLLYEKRKLEAVGTLASGIAHDFNNILTSVIGYAEIAKTESSQDDRHFALDQVMDVAKRAKRLTQQIREIGSEHNTSPEHKFEQHELIDLKEEVDELLLSMAPAVPDGIKIVKRFDPQARFEIVADPTKIYQLLLNLCTNALQAIGEAAGQVSIDICEKTDRQRQGYCLTVQDSGRGMTQQELEQIFEPYFTTRKKKGGTGLGLSLCYSIVEGHDGHIKASSELNKGSCFSVWLPRAGAGQRVRAAVTQVTQNYRVLWVDDDEIIVAMAKRRLAAFGYHVTVFTDCNAALAEFGQAPQAYDLVVSDLNMPQMTGVQFAEAIQARVADKPVIIVTATPDLVNTEKSSALISKVISKPIAFSELNSAITSLFTQREAKDGSVNR
jgi:signal transduction histidine kinase/ActR/RegA family two-component response regulator